MTRPSLAGRTAVITGSTQGWGRAVAEGMASSGARVVINGRHENVHEVAESIRTTGADAFAVRTRADTPEGVTRLIDSATEHYGVIDIWVNALGFMRPESLLQIEHSSWQKTLKVQLDSVFIATQAAARQMVDQRHGGRIINVVGGAAFGSPGASAHAASKGGALAATYSWAEELKPYEITVNAIRGGVQSQGMRVFLDGMGLLPEGAAEPSDEQWRALGFYTRAEAAPLAVWLASDDAADVTGWYIGIDGSRIIVYGRVSTELELHDERGWNPERLEAALHTELRRLPPPSEGGSQRRPNSGAQTRFDERVSP